MKENRPSKKILITGMKSYIGTSLERWLLKQPEKYIVETINLRDDKWKDTSFSKYDVIFHPVGIAHIKETNENICLYYKVNRDLAIEIAMKARNDGVKQFILLSSMSVYGIESGIIDENSKTTPKSHYGISKLQAENAIIDLSNVNFLVAVIRPPMVYGKDCKGNYPKLSNLALKSFTFPSIHNSRSMIYIDNLSELVKLLIDNNDGGLFLPQNEEYVCTTEMVSLIRKAHNKRLWSIKLLNPLIKVLKNNTLSKVFGDLVYKKSLSIYKENYSVYDFKSSISLTERRNFK
ncbi:NAD-dependent epimerase/dehydratase family protein [Sporosarcina sp. CAU 1771]